MRADVQKAFVKPMSAPRDLLRRHARLQGGEYVGGEELDRSRRRLEVHTRVVEPNNQVRVSVVERSQQRQESSEPLLRSSRRGREPQVLLGRRRWFEPVVLRRIRPFPPPPLPPPPLHHPRPHPAAPP